MSELVTATAGKGIVGKLLTSEGTYSTTLLVWLLDQYGMEVLDWHPETIKLELRDDFQVNVPRFIIDRIMAGICVLTTDLFFQNVSKFIQLCNVFSGDEFDPRTFDIADAGECAWGITEALLLNPPDKEEPEPFGDEIRHYLAAILKEEGFITPPDILAIALHANWSDQIQFEFADDPDMQGAIYDTQKGKADDIVDLIRNGLQNLYAQIKSLPLRNGKSDILNRIGTLWRAQDDDTNQPV